MFCPNCGASDQTPKSYCRRCGKWLVDKAGRSSAKPEDRMKVMLVFNALSAFMAAFAAIVLYVTYLGTPEAKWSIYVAGAFCSVIAVHQAVSFTFALELKLRSRRGQKDLPELGTANSETVGYLDGRNTHQLLDVPSVTENSTELLQMGPQRSAVTKQR